MGIDSQAQWIPSPFYTVGRNGYSPKWLILHGTAGGSSAQGTASWFQNPQAQVSSHYIVGQDGAIVACVDENNWSWANGVLSAGHDAWWSESVNPNWVTISIEHVKSDKYNQAPLTDAQKAASFPLISRICDRWGIPKRSADASGGITGHFSIDPQNRSDCPGTFPWSDLWTFLGQEQTKMIDIHSPGVADHFQAVDANKWYCTTTGKYITYGLLNFYQLFGGDHLAGLTYLGLPLSNEMYPLPETAVQVFECAIAVYDPSGKIDSRPGSPSCYLLHLDKGQGQQLIAQPLITTLQTQLQQAAQSNTALQSQVTQLQTQLTQLQQVNSQASNMLLSLHQIYQIAGQFK